MLSEGVSRRTYYAAVGTPNGAQSAETKTLGNSRAGKVAAKERVGCLWSSPEVSEGTSNVFEASNHFRQSTAHWTRFYNVSRVINFRADF